MLVSDSKIRSDVGDSDGDWLDREDLKTNGFQEMPLAVHLQDLVSTEKSLLTRAGSNLSWNASLQEPYAGLKGGRTSCAYPLHLRTLSAFTAGGVLFFAATMRSSKASLPLVHSCKAE